MIDGFENVVFDGRYGLCGFYGWMNTQSRFLSLIYDLLNQYNQSEFIGMICDSIYSLLWHVSWR
jgi:hypothetical protein